MAMPFNWLAMAVIAEMLESADALVDAVLERQQVTGLAGQALGDEKRRRVIGGPVHPELGDDAFADPGGERGRPFGQQKGALGRRGQRHVGHISLCLPSSINVDVGI
ncbi:MAG TPA: hypothetical protein EYM71_03530 [Rhodospirillales bacterium]|nr:hypothetical protein [Rhodospirillales bacterium]